MHVKLAQWCLTLCDPMDYTVHGILQARILEWVAVPFSRGYSQPRDETQVSHIAGGFFISLSHKGRWRILEWVAYPFSSGSSRPRNRTGVSCSAGGFFINWAIRYVVEGNGTPLQNSCLENPMDRGAWKAAVHEVAKSQTRLSDFTFTFHFHALEKEMAAYSSVLAWRIPGTGEPGGLLSTGSHRVEHNRSDLAAAA